MNSIGEATLAAFANSGDDKWQADDGSDIGKYFKDSVFFTLEANGKKRRLSGLDTKESMPKEQEKSNPVRSSGNSQKSKNKRDEGKLDFSNVTKRKSDDALGESQRLEVKKDSLSVSRRKSDNSLDSSSRMVSKNIESSVLSRPLQGNKSALSVSTKIEISSSSIISTQERCKLSSWGLPQSILNRYEKRGIVNMLSWQMECLSNENVIMHNKNLIYTAPTSAGKTLVAEMIVIKTVLERRKKVIFILPFVSVVREKMYYFKDLFSDSGVRVEGYMGGISPRGGFSSTSIAIATIEKANSLINRLMEEGGLDTLGTVVIDELHLLGDPHRGYLLELLLTKLKYMIIRQKINVQFVGMSATLPNLDILAKWLDADLFRTDFRPIPLDEMCKIGTTIYNKELKPVRNIKPLAELKLDNDNIVQLCMETIANGHNILIFCPTKDWCESLASQAANTFCQLGRGTSESGKMLREQLDTTKIRDTLEQLKRSPAGLDGVLKKVVCYGVAFHHAGLTMDERDIIEASFRCGSIRVLAATSTLSNGVNLPARRVIIRSIMFNRKPIDTMTYKQMTGRAGRMGQNTAGESIVVCKPNEKQLAANLLRASLPPIESCLEGSRPLIRALLEAVASEVAYTSEDLKLYTECTLLHFSQSERNEDKNRSNSSSSASTTEDAIDFLIQNEFLMMQETKGEKRWVATPLGKACLGASMPPEEGLFLFQELQKARRCFVLDTELHIIYLVTPYSASSQIGQIDWTVYLDIWQEISESERRVGELIGVEERFLVSALRGMSKQSQKLVSIHKRFYTALALLELVREVPLVTVCRKYGCNRGVLQGLQQTAATYAGMVTRFCKELGWNCMEILIDQFQTRLQFGVSRELLDLLRLPMLNGLRARSLYKEGITSIAELAVAHELDVERALHKALPFESGKEIAGEHEADAAKRNKVRTVFVTGKDGLTAQQAAAALIEEARVYLQNELGIDGVEWKANKEDSTRCEDNETSKSSIKQSPKESFVDSAYINKTLGEDHSVNASRKVSVEVHVAETPLGQEAVNKSKTPSQIVLNKTAQVQLERIDPEMEKSKLRNSQDASVSKPNITPLNEVKATNAKSTTGNTLKNKKVNQTEDKMESIEKEISRDARKSMERKISKEINGTSLRESETSANKENKNFNLSNRESLDLFDDVFDSPVSSDSKKNTAETITNTSPAESPTLFEDSIDIDTQLNNILEQNVAESLASLKAKETQTQPKKSESSQDKVELSLNDKQVQLSGWPENDSWNEPSKLIQKVMAMDAAVQVKQLKSPEENKSTRKSIDDDDTVASSQAPYQSPARITQRKNKRLKQLAESPMSARSPIARLLTFKRDGRKLSVGSNASTDSDDALVTSSQQSNTAAQNRTRKKIEAVGKSKTAEEAKRMIDNKRKLDKIECEKTTMAKRISIDEIPGSDVDEKIDDVRKDKTGQRAASKTIKLVKEDSKDKESRSKKPVKIPSSIDSMDVLHVAVVNDLFRDFKSKIVKRREISMALSCVAYNDPRAAIGSKVIGTKRTLTGNSFVSDDANSDHSVKLCGVGFFWEGSELYYLSLESSPDSRVPVKDRLTILTDILTNPQLSVHCFAAKEAHKTLYKCCKITATCRFYDPNVADWLLNSETSEKSYHCLISEHFPNGTQLINQTEVSYKCIGPGMNVNSSLANDKKAAVEALLTWHLTTALLKKLSEYSGTLLYTYKEIEMKVVMILSCMELNGLAISERSLTELNERIKQDMSKLQQKVFLQAKTKFNIDSTREVAKVLGIKGSTAKNVLEKSENPLAKLILHYRKLSSTQSKTLIPLLNSIKGKTRIHGNCITRTATGRVTMHEPNLQNIPKDFETIKNLIISVRMAFAPMSGYVILSADYCQLELRILAHFSKDIALCEAINRNGDVFSNIAASWNGISAEQVDDKKRQQTKQLCYGMIYGMGIKTLAETLGVSEVEANQFLDKFMTTYPKIRIWYKSVIEMAKSNGYVSTLAGRRRYLPALNSEKRGEKAQAERQAVNTKIQGSAADIAKKAMVSIEERLRHEFPNSPQVVGDYLNKRLLRRNRDDQPRGGVFVLQLHDELIYEVNASDLRHVAAIVKESMEDAWKLTVPLPVKVKSGPAWGDLEICEF